MFRSGFVSIVGRPNVGKSTLLNCILGKKVSIVSPRPQTTRNKVLGIKNVSGAQIVFLDTPGIHHAESKLNKYMVTVALSTLNEVDAAIFMVESRGPIREDDKFIINSLNRLNALVILVINKVDLVKKELLLPLIDSYRSLFDFYRIIPCSSLRGDGVLVLIDEIVNVLPQGPQYFPGDMITDQPERMIVSEIIREKVMRLTSQEIPYSVAVMVNSFEEKKHVIVINAAINVERSSQKGIIIGKDGKMLREIGKRARVELEGILGARIYLELLVRVQNNWSKDNKLLASYGYHID